LTLGVSPRQTTYLVPIPTVGRYEHDAEVAAITHSVSVVVGLIGVHPARAIVNIAAHTIYICIVVRIVRTTVAGVAHSVIVGIRLIGVGHLRAVVVVVKQTVTILVCDPIQGR
jgi:hypothetical protein